MPFDDARLRRAASLLGAILLFSCGGSRSEAPRPESGLVLESRPVRLLEGMASAGDRRSVTLAEDTWDALVTPVPAEVAVPVRLEGSPRLELGLGAPPSADTALRFEVRWRAPGGRERALLTRTVERTERGRWHSVAVELPGTGAGELVFAVSSEAPGSETRAYWGCPVLDPRRPPRRPSVVLVLLDTLRADRLGAYGYRRPTSPRLDALAAEGTLFERAIAQAPWTLPATMSIMTSRNPGEHGMTDPERRMAASIETLAEQYAAAGYRTAAFTEGGMVDAQLGFWRGFEHYRSAHEGRDAAQTFASAREWLREQAGQETFLFVHTYQPHVPYRPPDEHLDAVSPPERRGAIHPRLDEGFEAASVLRGVQDRSRKEGPLVERPFTADDLDHIQRLYDGEIRFADQCVGELLDELDALGDRERTVVLVASDHGEDFYDHFAFALHAHSLFDELLHVPLIVAGPGIEGGARIETPVAQLDIAPTLLELCGLEVPAGFRGRSLVPALRGEPLAPRPVFSEQAPLLFGLTTERYKLIQASTAYPKRVERQVALQIASFRELLQLDVEPFFEDLEGVPAEMMLFDLEGDPSERHNIAPNRPEIASRLQRAIEAQREQDQRRAPRSREQPLSPELARRLHQLGYR